MSRVIGLIALVILAAVGVGAVQAALYDAGDQTSIDGEEFTPDAGNYTTLQNSSIDGATYTENPTVRLNGTIVQEGDDYVWNRSDGRIKAVQGGALDGESTATIDYAWSQPTGEQRQLAELAGGSLNIAGMFILVLGAGLVISMLGVISRL